MNAQLMPDSNPTPSPDGQPNLEMRDSVVGALFGADTSSGGMHVPQTDIVLRYEGVELARKTLPPGEYVIGREVGVDIHAETPLISRQHARLTINYDHVLLE